MHNLRGGRCYRCSCTYSCNNVGSGPTNTIVDVCPRCIESATRLGSWTAVERAGTDKRRRGAVSGCGAGCTVVNAIFIASAIPRIIKGRIIRNRSGDERVHAAGRIQNHHDVGRAGGCTTAVKNFSIVSHGTHAANQSDAGSQQDDEALRVAYELLHF